MLEGLSREDYNSRVLIEHELGQGLAWSERKGLIFLLLYKANLQHWTVLSGL